MRKIDINISFIVSGAVDPDDLCAYLKEDLGCQHGILNPGVREIISDEICANRSNTECKVVGLIENAGGVEE